MSERKLTKREQALYRVNTAIKRIPARKIREVALHHFTPRYPKSISGSLRIDCWCASEPFLSICLDTYELARMVNWFNDHVECKPKEEAP